MLTYIIKKYQGGIGISISYNILCPVYTRNIFGIENVMTMPIIIIINSLLQTNVHIHVKKYIYKMQSKRKS